MKSILLLVVSGLLTGLSFSQENLIKSLKGKSKEKLEAQDFNTTRSNKERGNLQDDRSKKSSEETPGAPASPAPASPDTMASSPVTYETTYIFDVNCTYQIDVKEEGSKSQTITYLFGKDAFKADVAEGTSMIWDSKNKVMITIMEAQKSAMVMSTDRVEAMMNQKSAKSTGHESSNAKITRTGKTKVILGYTCEEVLIESDEHKTQLWVAKDTGVNITEAFASYFSKSMKGASDSDAMAGGILMEMTAYDKQGKETMHMLMTALSKEMVKFFLGAYKITTL